MEHHSDDPAPGSPSTPPVAGIGSPVEPPPAGDDGRRVVHLGHGHEVVVRPLRPTDRPALEALFADLPLEDLRLRFFSGCLPAANVLDHWFVAEARGGGRLVAEEDGEIIADAGYFRLEDGDAEFDITVESHHRGWLGPYLLDAVVDHARRRGIRNLMAEVDRSNGRMLALLRERGYVTVGFEDANILRVAIGVREPVPVWPDDGGGHPRIVLEGRSLPLNADGWARAYDAKLVACHLASVRGRSHCPALAGRPCPLAAGADAVIVAFPESDERARTLLDVHHREHPRAHVFVRGWDRPGPADVDVIDAVNPDGVADVLTHLGVPVRLTRRLRRYHAASDHDGLDDPGGTELGGTELGGTDEPGGT